MGFEQYTHARESMLRSGERRRAEMERMRDRRTMQQAGNALASGDTRSAIDTFNRAGMIGEAGAIEQRNVAEKTQHRAAQQAAVISGATGLLYVPPEQRMQTFRQRIAPVLRQTGVPEDAIARVADGDLSDETLRGLIRSLGGELESPSYHSGGAGDVVGIDPYSGRAGLAYDAPDRPIVTPFGIITPPPREGADSPSGLAPNTQPVPQAAPAAPQGSEDQFRANAAGLQSEISAILPQARFTSGYRSPERNAELIESGAPAVPNSRHMTGDAADFQVPGMGAQDVPRVRQMLDDAGVAYEDVIYHNNHFHVERGPRTRMVSGSPMMAAGAAVPMQQDVGGGWTLQPMTTPAQARAERTEQRTASQQEVTNSREAERLRMERERHERQMRALPAGVESAEAADLEAMQGAAAINAELERYGGMIQGGQMNLGPLETMGASFLNAIGRSNQNSRNIGSFQAALEKMRNDSLRLNNGVQTDGDAQRAWNELIANINDEQFVMQRLREIDQINARGVQLRLARVNARRERYGLDPVNPEDYGIPAPRPSGQQDIAQSPRNQERGQANQAQVNATRGLRARGDYDRSAPLGERLRPHILSPGVSASSLPSGSYYIDLEGNLRRRR